MNATQIQCFMAAAKHMNFTRASEELFITQPALSRNISGLEEELELLLFVRHNNVLNITPGGQILYNWLRQTSKGFDEVLDSARRANARRSQALRIGFVRSEAPTPAVAKALERMAERDREAEVLFDHFHAREIVDRLEEHTMDVAVMVSSAVHDNPRLVSHTLSTLQRCVAVSIRHPLAKRKRISLRDCAEETFVSVRPEVSPTLTPMILRECRRCGFTPKVVEAGSTEEMSQWIVSGRGIGLLVENHMQRNNPLFAFLELEEELMVELVCVWDRLNGNPHIRTFVDAFAE